jgi:hypothetical protein
MSRTPNTLALESEHLAIEIASAGTHVLTVTQDDEPIATVVPIALWRVLERVPFYRALIESYDLNGCHRQHVQFAVTSRILPPLAND